MAKVSLVQRDLKRRKLWNKYKDKRAGLLAIANNKSVTAEERFEARLKLSKLPRNSSKSRIRNLQSIGRVLRKGNKKTSATLYDIADDITYKSRKNYTLNHLIERIKIYAEENFNYDIVTIPLKN